MRITTWSAKSSASRIDDTASLGELNIALNADTKDYTLTWGHALPLTQGLDLITELGLNKSVHNMTQQRFAKGGPTVSDHHRRNKNSLAWTIGLRGEISDALELAGSVSGTRDNTVFALNAPFNLTYRLDINAVYSYTWDNRGPFNRRQSAFGIGLRYAF